MKFKKKMLSIILCFIMCISLFSTVSFAAEEGDIVDGSLLTHEQSAQDRKPLVPEGSYNDSEISTYGNHLATGMVRIVNEGNGVVYISGETDCYSICDSVSVNIYLERLVNGSWQTVSSRSHTSTNTHFTSYGISLAVKKGYYYRVTGSHSATKNGKTESTSSATNGIYIN